ncbi:MAG: 50S ribosomal protein L18 [Pseudomonadales bacterium]|jgi:large subunit ribosomal protein L18|nr:50S ribosomal protein L18 [Pseudomonadales bacterium]
MAKIQHQYSQIQKRKLRIRAKVKATEGRPKLTFTRSNKHLYMQVIDANGKVLAVASDMALIRNKKLDAKQTKTVRGAETAKVLLADLKKNKITALAVDRGQYKYAGRVKAAVEVIRAGGVKV